MRITAPHQGLIIAATGKVCLNRHTPVVSDLPLSGAEYGLEAQEFLSASRLVDPESVANAALEAAAGATTLLYTVDNVVQWIYTNIRYERGHTSVNTTAADVLVSLRGVCQDQAHLGLAMLRALGIPARYVSGLLTRQPRGDPRLDRIFASSPRLVARRSHPWRRNPHLAPITLNSVSVAIIRKFRRSPVHSFHVEADTSISPPRRSSSIAIPFPWMTP